MDNPNVNIRRRNSLPVIDPRRSTRFFCTQHRSNPYVGWFRHSPPTSKDYQSPATTTTIKSLKSSPYVGWFRHAPPKSLLQKELYNMLVQSTIPQTNGVFQLTDLLSGHLRGGSKKSALTITSETSTPPVVQVLSKLACWFFQSFNNNNDTYRIKSRESSCCDEDDYIYDDDSICTSSCETTTTPQQQQQDLDISVSSQAEAYYAHQAAKELDYDDEEQQHRLDYVITQMDIVRMTRNASRHLDVESILKLPTITYHKKPEAQPKQQQQQEESEGWSWMLVQRGLETTTDSEAERHKAKEEEQQDVCVICLEHFENGDSLRVLPCNHSFHVGCIDRWLSGSHSFDDCITSGCPTCKKRPDFDGSDGSVPSWAFAQIGSALSRDSRHF